MDGRAPGAAETGGAVTLKDVARAAGVSEATASRVLHLGPQAGAITGETRERVRRAAADAGYRANTLARSLSRSRTEALGVVVELTERQDAVSKPYNSSILAGIAQAAGARGYALALYQGQSTREDYAALLADGRVDGGLVVDRTVLEPAQLERLAASRLPVVMVGHRLPETGLPFVAADEREASAALTRHLLALGHRRILLISWHRGRPELQQRLGFLDAMAEAGLVRAGDALDEERVIAYEVTDDPFEHTPLLRAVLARREPPTALIAWNDVLAASLMRSARLLGIAVPGRLSIAGFNETTVAQVTSPRLTTVQMPLFEMGRAAAELLIGRLQGTAPTEATPQRVQQVLPCEVTVRESCAPPATGA